jgi:HEAT repeat protein
MIVRGAAVDALARNFKDDPDTLLILKCALVDNDEFVRYGSVDALARNFKDHPDTLPLLKYHAKADNDSDVRSAAVQALVSNFKDHPTPSHCSKTARSLIMIRMCEVQQSKL